MVRTCTRCQCHFDDDSHPRRVGCWCHRWWCSESCAKQDDYRFIGDAYEIDLVDCRHCRKQWCKGDCGRHAEMKLVWLWGKDNKPARIEIPWCGKDDWCSIRHALSKCWSTSKPGKLIREGRDYELYAWQGGRIVSKVNCSGRVDGPGFILTCEVDRNVGEMTRCRIGVAVGSRGPDTLQQIVDGLMPWLTEVVDGARTK